MNLINEFKKIRADAYESIHYQEAEKFFFPDTELPPRWFMWLEAWKDAIKWRFSALICHIFGHKYIFLGGQANGETAFEDFHCTRCNHHEHHVYY